MTKYLGSKTAFEGLDTFPLTQGTRVVMVSDEVTSVCPITGQPDYYTVSIAYVSDGKGLESKSLKLYLQTFRNEGIFCEHFAFQIKETVIAALQPQSCSVSVKQKPRGGISIEATV